ncbi:8-hydroxyquercetin 8-O-methyltransferase-like [Euphorbia lathyris]|uniref:8-hydroxyquercetin 8-O-methyltransferase-like n=1 Tax=Euphorbia lathyris TaxID=212925 RepID=UPI003314450E
MDSQKAEEQLKAQVHLYNHIFKYMNSMSLKCAVELNIADTIHNHGKPINLPQLASSLQIHPTKINSLYRLMRILVFSGFFSTVKIPNNQEQDQDQDQEQEQEAYVLTTSSKLLVTENPNCLTPFVNSLLKLDFVSPGHMLGDWFVGEEVTVFEKAHGMAFWEYNERNPEFNELFNGAMACDSKMMNLVIRDCKPIFKGVNSMVDVGGGNGSLARIISESFPSMKCTVLELPQVISNLQGTKNLEFLGGDMFQHIPSADCVLLKLIMHGWSDEECVKILKKCKEAIGKGGKVIVIDLVINEKKDTHESTETKLLFDMLMMFVATGKERSVKEWENLFLKAGFSHYKFNPLLGLRSLIEVYP